MSSSPTTPNRVGPRPTSQFTLLGDLPCVEEEDPLGFDAISAQLTSLVLASRGSTPFTFGINAGWGMGKSSLMRQLQRMLDAEDGIKTVWFNAWTAEGKSVLEGLIKSVLDQVDPNILRRTMRKRNLVKGLRLAASVIASWLRLGSLADEVWKRMSVDPRARNEIRDLMVSTMEEWMSKSPNLSEGRLLVVFIDDLDRCSPGNVLQVFEAIKLYLDAPGFVFVIGYDPSVVTDAILDQKQYSASTTGREYLEKIIQITFRIQQPDDEQVQRLMTACVERSHTAALFSDSSPRSLVIERNARNPRRIKRFINGFILEYGLDREWESLGAESLVKALILQTYFPSFAQLFDERAVRNPLTEFLDYIEVRAALRRQVSKDSAEWGKVEEIFASWELGTSLLEDVNYAQLLQTLEEDLPEPFTQLARDEKFVSLVQSMGGSPELELLRRKLERRRTTEVRAAAVPESLLDLGEAAEVVSLARLRVLWIDDNPEGNEGLIRRIQETGAVVTTCRDYDEAVSGLGAPNAVDVVISDITRSGDPQAGFKDVERLRTEVGYRGPVVFYAGRITPARRKAGLAVGARGMTSDPVELLRILQQVAEPSAEIFEGDRTGTVFIDYRRQDSAAYAGRLYDQLAREFGNERVFMDVENLSPGAEWTSSLTAAVSSADAFLEIIGPQWLSATDSEGHRRLDDPNDTVRVALRAALAAEMVVIPVLVEGASPPSPRDLPEDLMGLATRQAIELSTERWQYDVSRLVQALQEIHEPRTPSDRGTRRRSK
jgi:CheY-like chemotaxis protein